MKRNSVVTAEEKVQIDQWLEYRKAQVDKCSSNEKDMQRTLRELDGFLSDKVYFVSNRVTAADEALYHGLHHIFVTLSVYDKQQYVNLSRWFDQVQNLAGFQRGLVPIFFSKNQIYGRTAVS